MAATEPVTPRRMLGMPLLLVQAFNGVKEEGGHLAAAHAVVLAAAWAQVGPGSRPFQRIGDHEVGGGIEAGALGNLQQLPFVDADLEFEFDQDSLETPGG